MGVNFEVFQLLLNLYLKELGMSEGDIGDIIAARAAGMAMLAIPAAFILTRTKAVPVLLASCCGFALFSLGLVIVDELLLFIAFAMMAGASYTFVRVTSGPFFMSNSSARERTYLFSASFAVLLMAGVMGALGAGKLVTLINELADDRLLGYRITLALGVVTGLAALIPLGLIREKSKSDTLPMRLDWQQLKQRWNLYAKLMSSHFLVGIGAGLIIPFLNLYFRDRFGLKPDMIGLFYACVTAAMLLGTLLGPLLVKRFGLVRATVLTQLVSIPFMLILAYTTSLTLAFVAFVLRGGLMNVGVPIQTNLAMELSNRQEQPLVNALLMVSWTASWMIAAVVGGQLIEDHGYTLALEVAAALYVAASGLYYLFFRKAERRDKELTGWQLVDSEHI